MWAQVRNEPPTSWMLLRQPSPAVDLLEKMLVLDTEQRVTADEALAHSYFAQYHDPDDEPVAPPFDETLEGREISVEELKSEMGIDWRGLGEEVEQVRDYKLWEEFTIR